MKELQYFLQRFLDNKGHHVFVSLLIAKLCGFIGSWYIIRLLPKEEYGVLSIVLSILAIFIPFTGFGSYQSLLRFGSIERNLTDKNKLSSFLFYKGLVFEIALSAGFMAVFLFYRNRYEDILFMFLFCLVRLVGFYFLNHIQAYYRIIGRNDIFSKSNNLTNILGLIFIIVFTYFFGLYGYLLGIAITPYLCVLWFRKKMIGFKSFIPKNSSEILKFGFFAAFTAVISDILFSLDIILLGFLLNENTVADYRVAILLPSNITFLAITFMQSDFPVLTKHYQDKTFLKNYIINYYKLFIPLCAIILLMFYFLATFMLRFIFGEEYEHNSSLLIVLTIGFVVGMLFRNLYGNLLPAVGKIQKNTVVSLVILVILSIASFLLVPKFGVIGMGIAMSSALIIGGFLQAIFFYLYWKKLP